MLAFDGTMFWIMYLGFLDYRISGFLDTWLDMAGFLGHVDSWIPGLLDSWYSCILDSWDANPNPALALPLLGRVQDASR